MPSYIELDKSPILPSATAEGKVILGVTTQGNLTITNNVGDALPVGGGILETTREEIQTLIDSGSLTPGTHYKITNATTSSWETCLQDGGVTIILQAVTTASLSSKGIGLFWNPKYEDPNNPTTPPDTNYLVWSNTARLNIQNLSGHFEYNEYTYFYSSNTDNSTYAYIQGLPSNSGVTIAFENSASAAFFANPDNFVGLTMQGDWSGETADVTGNEYISSYAIGDKAIWGGRVWQNLSGSVGYSYGMGDVNSAMNLNPEDWVVVPYNDTDYTLVANEIEYEFERDNISYRNDGTNRIRSNWQESINNGWGWNTIKYYPWGHHLVQNNNFENVYLTNFVNYPHDAYAGELSFKTYSTLNAYAWGRNMSLYSITVEESAQIYDNTFSWGIEIGEVRMGQYSQMYNIITSENTYIEYIDIGMNARFGHLRMYNGSSIIRVQMGINSRLTNMYMYNNTHIYDVTLNSNAYLRCMYLDDYSEIKYVSVGNYSRIEYNNLDYSSCLKRISLANDCYITWSTIGVNSFFRQISLSDRAYINNVDIGEQSNLQNINMGCYSSMYNINGGYSTDFENIRIDANATINNIDMGYDGYISGIEVSPNSSIYNITNTYSTSSYISNISLQPDSSLNYINIHSNAYISNVYLGSNAYFGTILLEENAHISNFKFEGNTETGLIDILTGSSMSNFQIGLNSGFGEVTVASSSYLSDFTIKDGFNGIGGEYFATSLTNVTIGRGFNNFKANVFQVAGSTNTSYTPSDFQNAGSTLDINKSFHLIDITNQTQTLSWYLPDGIYEGQEVTFLLQNGGGANITPGQVYIFLNNFRNNAGNLEHNAPWYPFMEALNFNSWRNTGKAIWIGGAWNIDNGQWD